ncbi:DUF1360 domain-containing protein [Neobacillus niacini]|uniref:DUF1360 domain-containing protein n=1 Tax=Neobacillus niacini TaxID=86668 RepID=UPI00285E0DEC|nr:DUF1360 domain-containing protein [Neobacillus niacini]MDR7001046.1 hypothetical protein [Neobacillus niacini]
MFNMNWIDIFIITLASFRLTHLIVYDQIATFIRRPFLSVTVVENPNGQLEEHIEIKGTGIRHFIGSLLSCYWCTGIWSTTFVVIIYFYFPITFPIFLILAVAGAAAILESKI